MVQVRNAVKWLRLLQFGILCMRSLHMGLKQCIALIRVLHVNICVSHMRSMTPVIASLPGFAAFRVLPQRALACSWPRPARAAHLDAQHNQAARNIFAGVHSHKLHQQLW